MRIGGSDHDGYELSCRGGGCFRYGAWLSGDGVCSLDGDRVDERAGAASDGGRDEHAAHAGDFLSLRDGLCFRGELASLALYLIDDAVWDGCTGNVAC